MIIAGHYAPKLQPLALAASKATAEIMFAVGAIAVAAATGHASEFAR
jgi:hypothetical protein